MSDAQEDPAEVPRSADVPADRPHRIPALLVAVMAVLALLVPRDLVGGVPFRLPHAPLGPARPDREVGEALQVSVVDEAGEPVADATIVVYDEAHPDAEPRTGVTDENGQARITGITSGRLVVVVDHEAYGERSEVVVGPLPRALELDLRPAARILVHVRGTDGRPAHDCRVTLGGITVRPPRTQDCDASGSTRFRSLTEGAFDLRASAPGFASTRTMGLDAEAGAELEITLTLAAAVPLAGRVVDDTGAPLADVEIVVTEDAVDMVPHAHVTAADGAFRFDDLLARPYVVAARRVGFLPFGPVVVTPGPEPLVMTMVRAATLRGRVVDAYGEGVAGVVVSLVLPGRSVESVPAVGAAPAAFGFTSSGTEPVLQAAGELGVTLGDLPPIPLGVIAATPGSQPSFASTVVGALTGPDGVFELVGVPPGTVQLAAHHPSYPTVTSATRVVQAGEVFDGWNLVLPPSAEVVVRVVDARSRPVGDIALDLRTTGDDLPRSGVTDDRGECRFLGVSGIVVVTALSQGRAVGRGRTEVETGHTAELVIALEQTTAKMEGRVLDEGGQPIELARVKVSPMRGQTGFEAFVTTGEDGRFVVDGLPRGPYHVDVDHTDYAHLGRDDVRPDPFGRVEFRLVRGGVIVGRAVDADDERALAGVHVGLFDDDELRDEDATDARGRFRFDNVVPGAYELRFRHRDAMPREQPVRLNPSRYDEARTDVGTVELVATMTVRGVVVDALGDPVPRARVSIPRTLGAPTTTTDRQGRFELAGVSAGTHELEATHFRAGTARARRPVRGVARDVIEDVEILLPDRGQVDERRPDPAYVRGVAVALRETPEGMVVAWVGAGSLAEGAGVQVGDRIVQIDGGVPRTLLDAESALLGPTGIVTQLVVARGRGTRRFRIDRELYRPPEPDDLAR